MKFDDRWLYGLLLLVFAIPLLYPLGLPIYVTTTSRAAYNAIQNIPDGSHVLYSTSVGGGHWPEMEAQATAFFHHLFMKHHRFIWMVELVGSAELALPILNRMLTTYPGRTNGVDYVLLGFVPGVETGLAAVAKDMWYSEVDIYGNKLADMPLMQEVKTAADLDLVICITPDIPERYIRQFQASYGVKIVAGVIGSVVAPAVPYFMSGQLTGLLGGTPGGAEYEFLIRKPGKAIINNDALSLAHLLAIAAIVFANIDYVYKRRRK